MEHTEYYVDAKMLVGDSRHATTTESYGPFTERKQAESCVVQIAARARCCGATIREEVKHG